jgi:HD-like signal output (HDOD) protein
MSLGVDQLSELPPLPKAAHEILRLSTDAEVGASRYADIIESDPRMSLQVLQVANSPFFARRDAANNVQDAIVTVGTDETVRIAVSCALLGELGVRTPALDFDQVLQHGIVVARRWKAADPAAATAGVLVDAGLLAMTLEQTEFHQYAEAIHETATAGDLHDLERELFGIDRCGVAEMLAEVWKLPERVAEVLTGWHICRSEDHQLYDWFSDATASFDHKLIAALANR